MEIPRSLMTELEQQNIVLFVGADFPQSLTGVPSRQELAKLIAEEKGMKTYGSLAEVIAYGESSQNLYRITSLIRRNYYSANLQPQPVHLQIVEFVKKFKIETVISLSFDELLHQAFNQVGGCDFIVEEVDRRFRSKNRPQLINLFGAVQRPHTLSLLAEDFQWLEEKRGLFELVESKFYDHSILFLGHHLFERADLDFLLKFDNPGDKFHQPNFAVLDDYSDIEKDRWRQIRAEIIQTSPVEFLEKLAPLSIDTTESRKTSLQQEQSAQPQEPNPEPIETKSSNSANQGSTLRVEQPPQSTPTPSQRIFISHSSKDKRFVVKLANALKEAGCSVWYSDWEIKVGESIIQKINQGLSASDYLIVVLSPNSILSSWVQRELDQALMNQLSRRKITVLPVLYRDCEVPPLLEMIKYADFRNEFKNGLSELLNSIQNASALPESQTRKRDWVSTLGEWLGANWWQGVAAIVGIIALMVAIYQVFSSLPGGIELTPTNTTPPLVTPITPSPPSVVDQSSIPTQIPFAFKSIAFDPSSPSSAEEIKLFACTQGYGGVGITIKVSVNKATNGSDEGEWVFIKELGVPCFNQDDVPVWNTSGWEPGDHIVKFEAKAFDDPEWERAISTTAIYKLITESNSTPTPGVWVGEGIRLEISGNEVRNLEMDWPSPGVCSVSRHYKVFKGAELMIMNGSLDYSATISTDTQLHLSLEFISPTSGTAIWDITNTTCQNSGEISVNRGDLLSTETVAQPTQPVTITVTPGATLQMEPSCVWTWEFNTNGDREGWQVNLRVNNLRAMDGALRGEFSQFDPSILSPQQLNIDTSEYTILSIGYQIEADDINGQVMWNPNNDEGFSDVMHMLYGIVADGEWRTINIQLNDDADWTSTPIVNTLRLDPVKDATSGTFAYDYIRICK